MNLTTITHFKSRDLVRDLNLPKESSEILKSRLKEKMYLHQIQKFYRTGENELLSYFSSEENFVYCNNVLGLMQKMTLHDSSRSLKCVLLYNENKYDSITIGHSSTSMKKQYENIS